LNVDAIRLIAYGDPQDGLRLDTIDEPVAPAAGEALVAVHYAPINVSDLMVVKNIYPWKPSPPEVLGNEGAGVVLAVGDGVINVRPGDKVILPFMSRTWRQRLTVRADELVVLPEAADLVQASMLAINAATAYLLITQFVQLAPGDAVIYNAATSGFAQCVTQIARRLGYRTIGVVRREQDKQAVRSGGCEYVLTEDELDIADQSIAGLNIRLALEGVGGATAGKLAGKLADRGVLVAYAAASKKSMEISAQHLIFKRLQVCGFFEGHPERMEKVRFALQAIIDLGLVEHIRQPVAAIRGLDQWETAIAEAVQGKKVILRFIP